MSLQQHTDRIKLPGERNERRDTTMNSLRIGWLLLPMLLIRARGPVAAWSRRLEMLDEDPNIAIDYRADDDHLVESSSVVAGVSGNRINARANDDDDDYEYNDAAAAADDGGRLSFCGVYDPPSATSLADHLLYIRKWKRNVLTYSVLAHSAAVDRDVFMRLVEEAFATWSAQVELQFVHSPDNPDADIRIGFYRGPHGDDKPFNSTRVLGHAYYPQHGGVHLNIEVDWIVFDEKNPPNRYPDGSSLRHTLLHEIGHALGVKHVVSSTAVMGPFYTGFSANLHLEQLDIDGIRELYPARAEALDLPEPEENYIVTPALYDGWLRSLGIEPASSAATAAATAATTDVVPSRWWERTTAASPRTPRPTKTRPLLPMLPPPLPPPTRRPVSRSLCNASVVDEALALPSGRSAFIFIGQLCYRVVPELGLHSDYWPRRIDSVWPGLTGPIDAAFRYPASGKTYFFSNGRCWRYTGRTLDPGYPYPVSSRFPGIPQQPDAASLDTNGRDVLFFKGAYVWRYNRGVRSRQTVAQWSHGAGPKRVQAAFWRPKLMTMLNEASFYVRHNDGAISMARSTRRYWFGCPSGRRRTNSTRLYKRPFRSNMLEFK